MSIDKCFYREYAKEEHPPLDVIKEDIDCACCEKIIMRSVQIIDIIKPMQYKFTCPFCSGKSFLRKFQFQAHFEPVNCDIVNIEYDEKENLCLVHLKSQNVEK